MTKLSELNKQYRTDWKRGDIVQLSPSYGDETHYRLTGRHCSTAYHLVGIPLNTNAPKSYRAYFHPTSIKRVEKDKS